MHPKELSIKDYSYHLPEEKIAKYPLLKRDSSKLLIYQNQTIQEDKYCNIAAYLPHYSMIVFNQTKVVHARLLFRKPTGGQIEVFCLEPDRQYPDVTSAMSQQCEVYWQCLVGGAAKWKNDVVIELDNLNGLLIKATIAEKKEGCFLIHFTWNLPISFADVLYQAGKIPLPPYLNRAAEETDLKTYQTLFAKAEGSVAAPTAALHFTDYILQTLDIKQIQKQLITLHVGAGTFKPVKSEHMAGHDMHAEWIEVDYDFLNNLIQQIKIKQTIVAVGTTSCRTLESLYWIGVQLINNEVIDWHDVAVTQWYPYECTKQHDVIEALSALLYHLKNTQKSKLVTRTQIIIAPGYQLKIVDILVTNFHQPQSTLLLLVAAFVGKQWQSIYDYALHHEFRFLSYGDGCLIFKDGLKVG